MAGVTRFGGNDLWTGHENNDNNTGAPGMTRGQIVTLKPNHNDSWSDCHTKAQPQQNTPTQINGHAITPKGTEPCLVQDQVSLMNHKKHHQDHD